MRWEDITLSIVASLAVPVGMVRSRHQPWRKAEDATFSHHSICSLLNSSRCRSWHCFCGLNWVYNPQLEIDTICNRPKSLHRHGYRHTREFSQTSNLFSHGYTRGNWIRNYDGPDDDVQTSNLRPKSSDCWTGNHEMWKPHNTLSLYCLRNHLVGMINQRLHPQIPCSLFEVHLLSQRAEISTKPTDGIIVWHFSYCTYIHRYATITTLNSLNYCTIHILQRAGFFLLKKRKHCWSNDTYQRQAATAYRISCLNPDIIHRNKTISAWIYCKFFRLVITGQRIFPVGGREYQEYSVIFAQWNQINCSEPSYPKSW